MSALLYTQKEVLTLLKKNGVVSFNKSSFSEAVKIGKIPYRNETGVKNKLYCYDDVKSAIIKAGIGGVTNTNTNTNTNKQTVIEKIPDPKPTQTEEEYHELVAKDLNPNEEITLVDANIFKAVYQGKLEKIKYEKELGLLIDKDEVENKAYIVSRTIRDKILSLPERIGNELATISDPHVVKELLYKEFEEVLSNLSEDSFI